MPVNGNGRIIEVEQLTKRYGELIAVDAISFFVEQGEVFGILGPNGAGKTTTLEMVEGLRRPEGGTITVDGLSVWPSPKAVKARIGVQLQATALFDYQKLHEIIYIFGSCYGIHRSRTDCVALLERVGLAEKANVFANELSGGQAQRLSIALALVNDPVVTFLDEPTTGLDPRARRSLWGVIKQINDAGTTVVLTSHYMEEAERLCDRVAIMDHGSVIALGTPQQLIASIGGEHIVEFAVTSCEPGAQEASAHDAAHGVVDAEPLKAIPGIQSHRVDAGLHQLSVSELHTAVPRIFAALREQGLHLSEFRTHSATLEDVFVGLTGRNLRDE
jgi:ABC-2 type transport system ATP-binding protein